MTIHKFRVGEAVRFSPDRGQEYTGGELFEIVRMLPEARDAHEYRIKSQFDGHERVVREDQLRERELRDVRRKRADAAFPSAELEVRIHFPPADSPSLAQTRPLQVEKAAVPRGCAPLRSAETRSTGRNCANRRCYVCQAIFQYRRAAGRGLRHWRHPPQMRSG